MMLHLGQVYFLHASHFATLNIKKKWDLTKLAFCNASSRMLLAEAGIFKYYKCVTVENTLIVGIVGITALAHAKAPEFYLLSFLPDQCKINTGEKTKRKRQITF